MPLTPWSGPYGGVPPFDTMRLEELEPALLDAMRAHLAELDAIAADPAPPTFENTIAPYERAGMALEQVGVCYAVWRSNASSAPFRDLDKRLAPARAEHRARVGRHDALFARIDAVHRAVHAAEAPDAAQNTDAVGNPAAAAKDSDGDTGFSAEDRRLVDRIHDDFVRRGATLGPAERERLATVERRLAERYAAFRGRLLADEERYLLLREDQLGGLPDAMRRAAARAAETRGHPGRYAIANTRSAVHGFLARSTERALREQVWRAFTSRGSTDAADVDAADAADHADNHDVAADILRLRAERARLLGYPDYARFALAERMAGTPERVRALLDAVWAPALAKLRDETAALQALADRDGVTLAPWDQAFYAEQLRATLVPDLRDWLVLDRLVDAMHFVADTVFGLRFTPADGVPVLHPDVRVWEVHRRDGGALVGLWYLDAFARPGKRSGAWATAYRGYADLDGPRTVLSANNANFVPPAPGEPVLLSWDDARTLFHEFGHALHLLLARARWPTLGGGVRDYSELQSQLFEHWLPTGPVVRGFLRHHATGEPLPDVYVDRLARAGRLLSGHTTVAILTSAYLDLELHLADPAVDVRAFERALLDRLDLPPTAGPSHRAAHFAHVFADEGYAAGYYGYVWADVLTADAAEAFAAAPGGLYDPDVARLAVDHLFAPRDAVDPAVAWRAFRGRDADVGSLLRERGLV